MYFEPLPLPAPVVDIARDVVAIAMLLSIWRICAGPAAPDRVVALDLFASLVMAQLVLLVLDSGFVPYLDVAAVIAVISFIATVAFARYIEAKE